MISSQSHFTRLFNLPSWARRRTLTAVCIVIIGIPLIWASGDAVGLGNALWIGVGAAVILGTAHFLRVREHIQAVHQLRRELRIQRAAEELRSGSLLTRLNAIRTLEKFGASSSAHRSRTMDLLTAFIREAAVWEEPEQKSAQEATRGTRRLRLPTRCRPDIEKALDVVGRSRKADLLKEVDLNLDLSGVDLRRVGLVAAHLAGANLHRAHLEGAEMWRAHLARADLSGVHLDGANLAQANLENANLEEAHLPSANLQYARLQGARLGRADLSGTRLTLAHLEGADLSDAVGLTPSQVRGAYKDKNTRLPAYLRGLD